MLFSDGGKAVRFDEDDVRPMGRNARGVRGMMLDEGQGVIAMLVAEDETQSVLTATENGYGKRTSIVEYTRHGRGTKGMIAIQQSERNGKVVAATLVRPDDEIMLITDKGVPMGRNARGVRGMMLDEGQGVIAMLVAEDETQSVLTATENGYGKRTSILEYTRHGRGTKGMIAIQQSERNGKVVAATLVRAHDEIMLITDKGVLVRTRVSEIRELGRATQGVTLMALDAGSKLIGLQRIVENDANADLGSDAEGEARPDGDTPDTDGNDAT